MAASGSMQGTCERPHLHSGAQDQNVLDGWHKDAMPWLGQAHSADGLILPTVFHWHIIPACKHSARQTRECMLLYIATCMDRCDAPSEGPFWCPDQAMGIAVTRLPGYRFGHVHCHDMERLTIDRIATGTGSCPQTPRLCGWQGRLHRSRLSGRLCSAPAPWQAWHSGLASSPSAGLATARRVHAHHGHVRCNSMGTSGFDFKFACSMQDMVQP